MMPLMSEEAAKPKPRRWRRRLRRLMTLFFFSGLMLSGAAWLAYEYRLSIANRALEYLDPLGATLTYIDVDRSGNIDLRELKVIDKATGATLVQIPKLKAKIAWANALSGRLESLTIEQPEVSIDQAFLEKLLQQPAPAPPSPEEAATTPQSWHVDKLDLQKARLRFKQTNGTVAEITTSYSAADLDLSVGGTLSSGEQELTVEGGTLRTATGSELPLNLQRLHVQGRIKEGVLDLDHIALQRPTLALTPDLLVMLGLHRDRPSAPRSTAPPMIRGIRIGEVSVTDLNFSALGFQEGNPSGYNLPDIQFSLNQTARDITWNAGAGPAFGALEVALRDYSVAITGQPGHVRGPEVALKLGSYDGKGPWVIEDLALTTPDILWTTPLAGSFASKDAGGATTPATNTETPAVLIKKATLSEASIVVTAPEQVAFELHTKTSVVLNNLQVDGTGVRSAEPQSLTLTDTVLQFPHAAESPAKKPFVSLERGELVVTPDEWTQSKRIEKFALTKPVVLMRDGNTPWLDPAPATAPDPATPTTTTATHPWWQDISFGELTLADGTMEVLASAPKPVDTVARLNIVTEKDAAGANLHRIRIEDFAAKLPTLSRLPFPVATAGIIEGTVRLPQLWKEHHIEELRMDGGSIEAGEALMGLFEPDKNAAATSAPASASPAKPSTIEGTPWRVGHIQVSQSTVTIANLVPGLPTLKFGVAFDMTDAPLFAEDLARNVVPLRVELANITIPSPYEPLRPVVVLDSVFLHFTLDGLLRKEIDRVEIVSPALYVGEDLFWYVDYYRKYASRENATAPGSPQVAAAGPNEVPQQLAAEVLAKEPAASEAAWSVRRLQVHSGKLILAPKGKQLKGFREPFPFTIDTEIVRGTLEATLDIPNDTYTIEQYKLEFKNTRGHVSFNLPLRQKDNNMVETFEVDSIRWKELKTGKAFLTVTYDAAGIYSKFGAEAYEGYVNGELNVYLDDNFHWDGWLGAKNVQTHNITKAMTPGYFLMDGKVETTLVAQGSKDELYQADGSFKNHTPGRFSISALNDLVNDLPGDWTDLEKQITQMGVETFRDFDYDKADAKCRFYGREGNGFLHFTGPKGSRKFDINVYDHRWKTDAPAATQE